MKRMKSKLFNEIVKNILENPQITEVELANKYFCSERTIRRYLKVLKDKEFIEYHKNGKIRYWVVTAKYYSN